MSKYGELVKRLEDIKADRNAELEAAQAIERLAPYEDGTIFQQMDRLMKQLAEARAEIGRKDKALEFIAEAHDAGRHDGLPEPCPAHDADTMFAVAREALAAQAATDNPSGEVV